VARKTKDASGLKLVTEEARDVRKRFEELYDKANPSLPSGGAGPAALAAGEALRRLLRDNHAEELWRRIPGPMSVAESHAVEHFAGVTAGVRESWRARLNRLRKDFAGENPSYAESMLAQHAALCWLRLAEAEILHTSKLSAPHALSVGVYYEKRLTMAQRRFTKACETLERVRMMRRRAGQIRAAEAERRRA
jgi:hypothetical protein